MEQSAVLAHRGAPTGTQRSGCGGERRSKRNGVKPARRAGFMECSLSRRGDGVGGISSDDVTERDLRWG